MCKYEITQFSIKVSSHNIMTHYENTKYTMRVHILPINLFAKNF